MTEMIYGNTPCMLGAKNISATKDFSDVDVIVYGVPWEGAVTWGDYTGCELGPKVMRLCSARYSGYLPEINDMDIFEHVTLGDMGDIDIVPADVDETMKRITDFTSELWKSGKFVIGLGGDHGITYPIVKAIAEQDKKVGIIHLDAHYDNLPSHNGDQFARCSPFARLYEQEGVRNESIIHTGIHGPRNKPESGRNAKAAGAVTITINDIRGHKDLKEMAKEIYAQASKDLTSYELLTLVHEICKLGVIGMDFVEIYPQQDPNKFSAHFASTLILYALAGNILHNQQKEEK